jgi:hypothetical protein
MAEPLTVSVTIFGLPIDLEFEVITVNLDKLSIGKLSLASITPSLRLFKLRTGQKPTCSSARTVPAVDDPNRVGVQPKANHHIHVVSSLQNPGYQMAPNPPDLPVPDDPNKGLGAPILRNRNTNTFGLLERICDYLMMVVRWLDLSIFFAIPRLVSQVGLHQLERLDPRRTRKFNTACFYCRPGGGLIETFREYCEMMKLRPFPLHIVLSAGGKPAAPASQLLNEAI